MTKKTIDQIAKITPVGDYLLIRPDIQDKDAETKSAGGIIFASEAHKSGYKGPAYGVVSAISAKLKAKGVPFQVGDRVMYEKLTELSVHVNGERHILMKEETIYAVEN